MLVNHNVFLWSSVNETLCGLSEDRSLDNEMKLLLARAGN